MFKQLDKNIFESTTIKNRTDASVLSFCPTKSQEV